MSCYLLQLPTELQLKIVQTLIQSEADRYRYHRAGQEDETIRVYHDLIRWSSTCSYFRALLAHRVFKTVQLVNGEKSGSSLSAVAKSPYNIHVKELHFVGDLLGSSHSDEAVFLDTEGTLVRSEDVAFPHPEGTLARSVNDVLCHLERFPSLESVSIEFDIDMWDFGRWDAARAFNADLLATWLALISRTCSALTLNRTPHFKHLEIRQLVWKTVSTFSHAAFQEFLGHFEKFTLSVYSDDVCGVRLFDMPDSYRMAMTKLDDCFYNHLANVRTLSIKAPRGAAETPAGVEGMHYVLLALRPNQMPLLRTLHLDHIFVSRELIEFLVGHNDTLEELSLRKCYAGRPFPYLSIDDDNGINWSELFTSLFYACAAKLRRFELAGCGMPFPSEERLREEYLDEEETEKISTMLQQDPRRILFPYAYLAESSGELICYYKLSLKEFLKGEDQQCLDRLMVSVERNAKENAKSRRKGLHLQIQS